MRSNITLMSPGRFEAKLNGQTLAKNLKVQFSRPTDRGKSFS